MIWLSLVTSLALAQDADPLGLGTPPDAADPIAAEATEVVEGVIVGTGAVLSMGVFISATPTGMAADMNAPPGRPATSAPMIPIGPAPVTSTSSRTRLNEPSGCPLPDALVNRFPSKVQPRRRKFEP